MDISTKNQIIVAIIGGAIALSVALISKKTKGNNEREFIEKCTKRVILSASLIVFIIIVWPNPEKRSAEIYHSQVYNYEFADLDIDDELFEEFSETDMTEIDRAFSIISNVRNNGEKSSSIEEIRCDILDLEPIKEPIIEMDADIVDDTLKLFAFNDGWGNSDPLIIKSTSILDEESLNIIADLNSIARCTYIAEEPSLAPGDAILLAEYELDSIKFEESFEEGACEIEVIVNEDSIWGTTLAYEDNKFQLGYCGGDGDDTITTKRFAILDVDKVPTSLPFKNVTDIPLIDNVMHIVTVVAPTKSCVVKCKNVFSINGKRQETDIFKVKVHVPVFTYSVNEMAGPLTEELAHLENQDKRKIKKIVKKYLYDPKSILETSSETY